MCDRPGPFHNESPIIQRAMLYKRHSLACTFLYTERSWGGGWYEVGEGGGGGGGGLECLLVSPGRAIVSPGWASVLHGNMHPTARMLTYWGMLGTWFASMSLLLLWISGHLLWSLLQTGMLPMLERLLPLVTYRHFYLRPIAIEHHFPPPLWKKISISVFLGGGGGGGGGVRVAISVNGIVPPLHLQTPTYSIVAFCNWQPTCKALYTLLLRPPTPLVL